MTKEPEGYFKGRECCICGKDLSTGDHGIRHYDEKGIWDGISYWCRKHLTKEYNDARKLLTQISNRQKEKLVCIKCKKDKIYVKGLCKKCYDNDYYHNIRSDDIKSGRKCRNKDLSVNSAIGRGFVAEMTVAKVRNLKNCNIELDNFHAVFDLSIDSEYGKPQVKGPTFDRGYGKWKAKLGMEHNFDHVWIVCMDENRIHVIRVYIIPESELYGETQIDIYEDWSKVRGGSKFEWIEKYRVDEKPYDDAYHSLNLDDCKYLRKDE